MPEYEYTGAPAKVHQCSSAEALQQQCAQLEQTILNEYCFLPIFYKNQYCITKSSNKDIGYDPFSGALNFRNAKLGRVNAYRLSNWFWQDKRSNQDDQAHFNAGHLCDQQKDDALSVQKGLYQGIERTRCSCRVA